MPRSPQTPDSPSVHDELARLPRLHDEPLEAPWLARPQAPRGHTRPPGPNRRPSPRARTAADDPPADPRTFYVPAPEHLPPAAPPPRPDPVGPPAAPPPPASRVRRPRRRRRWLVRVLVVMLLLAVAQGAVLVWRYRSVDRISLGDALASGGSGGTNYLIVGTDSREGVDPGNPNAGVIFGDGVSGERTDTLVVLHVGGGGNAMLPVPRDLFVTVSGTGDQQRINAAIQQGPATLVATVQDTFGIPIHHYVEVDFAGFLGIVDAIGGVVVDFPNPAFDTHSGLSIPEAGPQRLDSDQALAFVRSRHYTEIIGGAEVTDPTADLGRIARQQDFLRTLFQDVGSTRNPLALNRVVASFTENVRVDDQLGFLDLVGLARRLGGLDPETLVLPVRPGNVDGASVLFLQEAEAEPVLARLR